MLIFIVIFCAGTFPVLLLLSLMGSHLRLLPVHWLVAHYFPCLNFVDPTLEGTVMKNSSTIYSVGSCLPIRCYLLQPMF